MAFDYWIDGFLLAIQLIIQENYFMGGELLIVNCNKHLRYMAIFRTVIFEKTLVKCKNRDTPGYIEIIAYNTELFLYI